MPSSDVAGVYHIKVEGLANFNSGGPCCDNGGIDFEFVAHALVNAAHLSSREPDCHIAAGDLPFFQHPERCEQAYKADVKSWSRLRYSSASSAPKHYIAHDEVVALFGHGGDPAARFWKPLCDKVYPPDEAIRMLPELN